jgi:hypothetical protein
MNNLYITLALVWVSAFLFIANVPAHKVSDEIAAVIIISFWMSTAGIIILSIARFFQ